MTDDSLLPFRFPAIGRKKVTAAFDGGRLSSDGGVMLLAQAERRLGLAERLAAVIPDGRDQSRVTHLLPDILRARIFAIACGYEDADDLDRLRLDPAFKLACGRLPDTGVDLCSQPTVSRWENAPSLRDLVRLMGVMVDLYCASYSAPPIAVTLDPRLREGRLSTTPSMSSTATNSFRSSMRMEPVLGLDPRDERCFLPIHIYDTATGRPVAVILRPGKTPSGREVRGHLRRLVRRIRKHWPHTHLTIRGDGHYSRPEVMAWCEENGLDFVFGLPGNAILAGAVEEAADDIRTRRALDQKPALRGFAETRYQAKSWKRERRACARIEATTKGLDIRFVVTSLHTGSAEHVYETLYCARGQAENLIKLHKAQLASDRTSCRSPLANQMRLILHTAAYWLTLTVRDAIPATHALAPAEFATIRLRLLKLGTRVIETASRVRLAFAAACPDAALFRHITAALMPTGP